MSVNGDFDTTKGIAPSTDSESDVLTTFVRNTARALPIHVVIVFRRPFRSMIGNGGTPAMMIFLVSGGEGLGLVTVEGDHLPLPRVWASTAIREDAYSPRMRSGVGAGVGGSRCRAVERTAVGQPAADGENDAHGHGGCEDSCHGSDDGLDGIGLVSWGDDEPKEHIGEVHDPDGTIKIETIAQHQFPWGKMLRG